MNKKRKEDIMKKANKKISKLLKVSLLLCMLFSQLANPISVLADQVVPSYNLEIEFDDKGDEDDTNDEFVITSNGTKALVEDEKYILEIIRSFKYADGTLNATENKKNYSLVLGSSLTEGVNIAHEMFSYNGVSYVNVNVYEVTDEEIDISTYPEEDYSTLLTTDSVENIMNTSFEEGVSYNETELAFVVSGETAVCDITDGYKCSVTLNNTNNIVEIDYLLKTGNLNPNNKYHIVLKVNGVVSDLVTEDIALTPEKLELDFSKMLPGVYNVLYSVRDSKNVEVFSNVVEFTYTNDEIIDKVDFIKNVNFGVELFYNYTVLTDIEKESLGNEYKVLDNPLAFIFDNLVSNVDVNVNYNLFDEDNRYHVVYGDGLVGAFDELSDVYTVGEVIEKLNISLPHTTVSIVDKNGQKVSEESYVENGMKLVVNIFGETLKYDLLVHGDVNGGYVDTSDLNSLIDKVLNNEITFYDTFNLDLNGDEVIDVIDISLLGVNIYDKNYSLPQIDVIDTITSVIESDKDELFVGENFEVTLSLNGFDENYINALEGFVSYDKEALELSKVEVLDELFVGKNLDNRFVYASDEVFDKNEESFVKLTFTALKEGTHKVLVNDLTLVSDGVVVLTEEKTNEVEVLVNRALHTDASLKSLKSSVGYFDKTFKSDVLEYTLYVDSYVNRVTLSGELNDEYATTEDLKEYVLTGDNTVISINVTAEDGTVKTYKVNVRKVYKSSNNNLKDIVIEGYEIDFFKDVLEYKITVGSDVTSLDITALVEDGSAWAKIEGNENFKEGENEVIITVYAEDGNAKTYKLLVNKEKAKVVSPVVDDEKVEENKINTEKVVIIILIILVVIGLLYLIFKKDEDLEEPRIEQIKPKKENDVKVEEVENNNSSDNNKHKK